VWAAPGSGSFTKLDNLSFPGFDTVRPVAHGRVILLAMNPGGNDPEHPRDDWSNFHSEGSNDHLLAEAFRETRLWGAFMTDLYFDQYESDSSKVDVSAAQSVRGVRRLVGLAGLGDLDPLIVCVGDRAQSGFSRGLANLKAQAAEPGRKLLPTLRSIKVSHYSGSNAGQHKHDPSIYRDRFHDKLRAAKRGDLLQ
jgi:hypothetical protein